MKGVRELRIVIDIPEEIYKTSQIIDVKHEDVVQIPLEVIANGTVLPEQHGRLIDVDKLRTKSIDVNAEFGNEWWCVDCDDIELAPTVLEADKENKDGDSN